MLKQPVYISGFGSISPLGHDEQTVKENLFSNQHFIRPIQFNEFKSIGGILSEDSEKIIEELRLENKHYKNLDKSVLMAIYASRKAFIDANWDTNDHIGINFGSSRGATALFEKHHSSFIESGQTSPSSSPTTTLGNISSWVAQDLNSSGPEISHSITCSTALHAILNAIAWLQSGLTEKFIVGGSEACMTPFTIAQMEALKIYSQDHDITGYPCRALDIHKENNTMVLGEAAAVACLSLSQTENTKTKIIGVGYATERLTHGASLSANADCFQKSMRMALGEQNPDEIDVIVTHTPGTLQGDQAELNAINKVFCNKTPYLTTNKSKIGHSLGASGILSLEMALLMLNHQKFINTPFLNQAEPNQISKIMINAVGFGGNAVSLIITN
ncbi:MAG: beta-ketoacyl synthase N-terminal-like domain-containing protein [bacterium]